MPRSSQYAIKELIEVATRLAEIVHELNPGADMQEISDRLATARKDLAQAEAFE